MDKGKAGFQPYEGAEPYIFASYSHADSETVLPILDALHKRGFRVWYDEGIPWTDEWENVVAAHVTNCAVCMAFHSGASRKSVHCDAELMYARRKNRPILSVYLEDGVELSPGVEMYLTRYQSVKWRDFAGTGEFLDRMEQQDAVRDCKIQPVWHYNGEIRWNLSGDGVLTIEARNPSYPAKMPDYECEVDEKLDEKLDEIDELEIFTELNKYIKEGLIRNPAPWMREWEKIISVVIERGITTIGEGAFSCCIGLTNVTIPDSVTEIVAGAFMGCSGLTSVRIPDSVTRIGEYAFSGCNGLKSVTIPDSVTEIGWEAFSGCSGLISVTIPDSVTEIDVGAFSGCSGLTSVRIPVSVTEIGLIAFSGCSGLTSVRIPDSVTEIWGKAFADCENLREISLPAGVEFYGNSFPDGARITVRRQGR